MFTSPEYSYSIIYLNHTSRPYPQLVFRPCCICMRMPASEKVYIYTYILYRYVYAHVFIELLAAQAPRTSHLQLRQLNVLSLWAFYIGLPRHHTMPIPQNKRLCCSTPQRTSIEGLMVSIFMVFGASQRVVAGCWLSRKVTLVWI